MRSDEKIVVQPVAFVRAARLEPEDDRWGGALAQIELADWLAEDSLAGLDAFSHVEILFHFHKVPTGKIEAGARHPRNNPSWPKVGIFAQRAKNRPNRIGSTLCKIRRIQGRTLVVEELDAIDGTPVLDIKPVMAQFLPREAVRQPAWAAELMASYWADGETG